MNRKIFAAFSFTIILLSVLASVMFSASATANPTQNAANNISTNLNSDWPMYHYNTIHTGSPDNIAPPTHDLLWSFNMQQDPYSTAIIASSPAVAGSMVYVGSDDGNFFALDTVSGNLIWNRTIGEYDVSSPSVKDGVVYVKSWEGRLYALDALTGAEIWNSSHLGYGISTPAVANGLTYIVGNTNVSAFSASNGSLVWTQQIGGNGDGSPTVADGTVYVNGYGGVYALDALTGALKWNQTTEAGSAYNTPAVANGVVYIGTSDDLFYALDAATGAPRWTYSMGTSDASTPTVVDGIVYVGAFHGFYALNAASGAKIWNYPAAQGQGTSSWFNTSPAFAGGVVYFGCHDGTIIALDAYTGAKLWSYKIGNEGITSAPAIVNGVLYVSGNGCLYAFGKANNPAISLFPKFGPAGTTSAISGRGFTAGSTVTATFDGAPIFLGNPTVDYLGHFSASIAIPSIATSGRHQIIATDSSSRSAATNFTVVDASPLPWPMFMHDLKHSGTPDNIAPTSNNTLWTYRVDRGEIDNQVASSAAVVGGIVYTASLNGFVYALDAYTGECYWKYSLPGLGTLSSPSVVDGVVYIGSDYGVIAINAYTGEKIWQSSNTADILSSPAIVGGVVFTGSFVSHGTDEHAILAFKASDGQQIWKYILNDYADSSPAVVGSTVYIGSDDGYLYALNAIDGSLIWKLDVRLNSNDDNSASPAIVNGVVYTSSYYGNVFAIDASSGSKIWNHTVGTLGTGFGSPIVSNGVLYINGRDFMFALNTSTGEEIWRTPIQSYGSPAIVGNIIYASSTDGKIYAINALTGEKTAHYTINAGIRVQLTIARGVIYAGTTQGVMYAIGTPDLITPQPTPEPTPTNFPIPTPTPNPTSTPTPHPTPTSPPPTSNPNPTSNPSQNPAATPTPTAAPTAQPTQTPTATPPAATPTPNEQTQTPIPPPVLIGGGIGATAVCVIGVGLVYYKRRLNLAKQLQNKE